MDSDTRRGFLHRSSQIGVAAVLGGVAGCMGRGGENSNSSNPKYIENISFSSSKMVIDPTKKAIGKTYQLLTPSGNESVWSETVSGDQTRIQMITRYLVDQEYPSGNYTLQVVDDTEVISERPIKLAPDVQIVDVGNIYTEPDVSPYLDVKLKNQGTLTARVEFTVPSGVPSTINETEMGTNRVDKNKTQYRNGVGIGETAIFNLDYFSLFLMSEKEMYNYTVGNSSFDSRKCDGKQRNAVLIIDIKNGGGIKYNFSYILSGDVSNSAMGYGCENVTISTHENTKTNS